jgi:hypothetical protein
MNIFKRLNAARSEFHQLELKKSGHNKFAGYNYFELGDFVVPALRLFEKHGICSTISFSGEARMDIVNVDDPSDRIVITSPMSSAQLKGCHEVQNLGAVQTYLRRYLWVAALEIVEHDAVDAGAKDEKGKDTTSRLGEVSAAVTNSDGWALLKIAREDHQGYLFAFGRLNSNQKKAARELEQLAAQHRLDYASGLIDAKDAKDELGGKQLWDELSTDGKRLVWEKLDSETQNFVKSLKEA